MADEEEVQEENEEKAKGAKKKSGGMKMIIIAVVALVVLGGGGAFAYFKFVAGGHEEKPAEPVHEEAEVDPKDLMFALDPFVVNLGGPSNFLKLSVQLELTDAAERPYIESRVAPIRDSVVILLSSKTSKSVVSPEGKLKLKDDLNMRVNQVLGKDVVRNVYFTEFVMQ